MNLRTAAETGDLERVQLLLGQGVDKDEVDCDGYTALFHASFQGYFAIVQALVEQGADKEKASVGGITPLNVATMADRSEVVR